MLGTVVAVVSSTEPDLYELTPIRQLEGQFELITWQALENGRISAGAAVQILGYMAEEREPARSGAQVRDFVLLPEAGSLMHPAHRLGDQMIAVHLREGERMHFSPKSLVWAWGTLRTSPVDPGGSEPLYHLDWAQARLADKADLHKFFR